MKIESFAAAKINLALHVTGIKLNGFHDLDSLVTFAKIGDVIEVTPYDKLRLSVTGPFANSIPKDVENIVIKAARFLSPEGKAHIKLTKNLPVEAGLGGGSADAAATLRSLSKLWNLPIPQFSETLGADVPVCLYNKPAVVKGIGEKITPILIPDNLKIVLIKPNIGLPTKKIFDNLNNKNNKEMVKFFGTNSLDLFLKHLNGLRNDLLNTSIYFAPIIKTLIEFLAMQTGVYYTQMSGSGTTCFALFDNTDNASNALLNAKKKFPGMWCQMTELINA